jgi:hypothetical protein
MLLIRLTSSSRKRRIGTHRAHSILLQVRKCEISHKNGTTGLLEMFRSRTECFWLQGHLSSAHLKRFARTPPAFGQSAGFIALRTAQEDEIAEDDDMDGRPKRAITKRKYRKRLRKIGKSRNLNSGQSGGSAREAYIHPFIQICGDETEQSFNQVGPLRLP